MEKKRIEKFSKVGNWFQILCFSSIPIFGFWYMVVLAVRKKTPEEKRSYAIAFLIFRILILLLAITILFVLYRVGLSFLDEILRYAGME
ncbi:MAG: hypothetical protein LUH14_08335 [Clostridiaceae bacterium]|nr:hypothetical protein [Clostridiaceae bacterium]